MPDPDPNALLIAVDVQRGFVTEHSRHVVAPIEAFQRHFGQVVLTRFYNPDPSPFRRILGYHKLAPGDAQAKLAIRPAEGALILGRPHYTCVTEALISHLRAHGFREAYLCGIATEACVLKTALDLFEKDIRCLLIRDLCASDQDACYHDMAVALLAKLIGKDNVISREEALRRLS